MNTIDDDPNEELEQLNRTFQFKGQALKPLSYTHRLAFFRLAAGETSVVENAVTLLYVLQHDAKTVDLLRSDEQKSAFRLKANAWADETLKTAADRESAINIYEAIWTDVERAERVSIKTSGTASDPNA